MAINLTTFNKNLHGGCRKSGDTKQDIQSFDQRKSSVSLARVLKGFSPLIDGSAAAFGGNSAFNTRRRGLGLW
ncbi:MAG: hypothetical protein IPN75_03490 [Dechloromonas sp.]|uniref:Uncharacterized protein n=1 Tax=Candidatus Dechloromonas phosphorivorans TaxID=2899244 RepID=A0A9D7LNE5_9RHOO|nr:hypothetical protein [Candidatus Dechloromonas phosphorivorans]